MINTIRIVNKFRTFPNVWYFSSFAKPFEDLGFKTSYDSEQTRKVLDVINSSTLLDMKKYQISHQRIQRVIKQREAKGHFQQIEDLLDIDGFGIKILEKFCNSIINYKPANDKDLGDKINSTIKDKKEFIKKQNLVTPVLLEVIRTKARSVVSFHVDLNYFAWTKFYYDRETNENLEEPKFFIDGWNCFEFARQEKHLRLTDLIELMIKFNDQIPHADLYTIESMPPAVQAKQPGSALQVNVNIQKTQLVAMLCALMASRRSANKLLAETDISDEINIQSDEHSKETPYVDSIYFLKNFLPSRFYKILVGNERVSTANVINQIISYNYTNHRNFDPVFAYVNIPEKYRNLWMKSSRIEQEYLGSSMIVGLTFLKLCIERCNRSLETLSVRTKKN